MLLVNSARPVRRGRSCDARNRQLSRLALLGAAPLCRGRSPSKRALAGYEKRRPVDIGRTYACPTRTSLSEQYDQFPYTSRIARALPCADAANRKRQNLWIRRTLNRAAYPLTTVASHSFLTGRTEKPSRPIRTRSRGGAWLPPLRCLRESCRCHPVSSLTAARAASAAVEGGRPRGQSPRLS
jgi:hypothetical protein